MPELENTCLQTQSPLVIGQQGVPQHLPRALSANLGIPLGPLPKRCFTGTVEIKNIFHPNLYLILPDGSRKIMYLPMDSTMAMMRLWTDVLPH